MKRQGFKLNFFRTLLYLLLVLTVPLTLSMSCGSNDDDGGTADSADAGDAGDSTDGTGMVEENVLYATDDLLNAIHVIENADTVTGTQTPIRVIRGSSTLLNNPRSIALDSENDILYVANGATPGTVLVFDATDDGDVAPVRTLTVGGQLEELIYDASDDQLFVLDVGNQQIKVWNNVMTADAATSPSQTINLDFGAGVMASSFVLDVSRDLLYVEDHSQAEIRIYSNASTLNGTPLPTVSFGSCVTVGDPSCDEYNTIFGMTLDETANILFALDSGDPRIHIYDDASSLMGMEPDDRFLPRTSNTSVPFSSGSLLWNGGSLYVNRAGGDIAVWDNANTVNGDVAPDRVIAIMGADRFSYFVLDF